jgi:hypothetical protein
VNDTVCQFHDDGAALERDWDRSRARDVARVAHAYALSTVGLEFSAIQAPPAGARGQTTQSSAASRGVA